MAAELLPVREVVFCLVRAAGLALDPIRAESFLQEWLCLLEARARVRFSDRARWVCPADVIPSVEEEQRPTFHHLASIGSAQVHLGQTSSWSSVAVEVQVDPLFQNCYGSLRKVRLLKRFTGEGLAARRIGRCLGLSSGG